MRPRHPLQVDSVIIDIARDQNLAVYMSKRLLIATDNRPTRNSSTQRRSPPSQVIPRIFHFVWLGSGPVPALQERRMLEWAHMHPGWDLELWNRTRIPPLPQHLNMLLSAALASPDTVFASHIIRYAAVLSFGGVFIDGSFEPLRPVEPILVGINAFVAHSSSIEFCSSVFGAVPGHPFLSQLAQEVPIDVPPVGGWIVAGWRVGARLITSVIRSSNFSANPRTRTFSTHIWFPLELGAGNKTVVSQASFPLSFAVHHSDTYETA